MSLGASGLLGVDLGGSAVVVLGGRARVAGATLLDFDVDAQVLAAQRLHLVGHFGPRVGGPHDRADAARLADGREPRDAGAGHQDLRRLHLARGGDLSTEEPAELVRCFVDGAVAGDVGHRAQHVEGLGARDARDRVHRQRRDRAGGQLLDELGVQAGRQDADQDGTLAEFPDLLIVRSVDLEDDVARPCLITPDDRCTRFGERLVGEGGFGPGAGLDGDVVTELDQLCDGRWRAGNA